MRFTKNGLSCLAMACFVLVPLSGCPSTAPPETSRSPEPQTSDERANASRVADTDTVAYDAPTAAGNERRDQASRTHRERVSDADPGPGEPVESGPKDIDDVPADNTDDDPVDGNNDKPADEPDGAIALANVPQPMPTMPAIDAGEDRWPLFRGDSHSSGVAVSTLPDKLDVLWRFRIEDGGFETTPAVVDDIVYVGDFDGTLLAIDAKTGDKKWEFAGELGFVASPSVYKGRVYIGDLDGTFYCVDAKSGQQVWQFKTEAEIDSCANFYNDNVLIGSQDATLYCLKAADGKPVWKFTIDDQIRCTPTIVDNRCFLAGCDGKLHIVDLDEGKAVDDVPIESPTGTTPAVNGQRVYFGTHAGDFFCIDWKQAKTIWTWQDKGNPSEFRSSAAVTDSYVVVGDRGRRLFALDPATGEQLWQFPTRRNVDSSPVIVGERVFFGSGDGIIYALDLKTGKEQWKYEAGGGFIGSPAVADQKLFIASEDGVLYCFGKKN